MIDAEKGLAILVNGFSRRLSGDLDTLRSAADLDRVILRNDPDTRAQHADTATHFFKDYPAGLPADCTLADAVGFVDAHAEDLVRDVANWTLRLVNLLIEKRYRKAVLHRLPERLSWPRGVNPAGDVLFHSSRPRPLPKNAPDPWPGEAAPLDVVRWAERAIGEWIDPGVASRLVEYVKGDRLPHGVGAPLDGVPTTLSPDAMAHLYLAEQEVIASARRPSFNIPLNREARTVARMMSAAPWQWENENGELDAVQVTKPGELRYEINWPGSAPEHTHQLMICFEGDLPEATVRDILAAEGEDGLRDWLALHKLAGEQGGTGEFVWNFDRHAELAGYTDRIRRKTITRGECAKQVLDRQRRFKLTEVWACRRVDDETQKVRVGHWGLIDIPAFVEKEGADVARLIRLNPMIYRNVSGRKGDHFTFFGDDALLLSGQSLRIYTLSMFAVADHRERLDELTLTARQLLDFAGVQPKPGRGARELRTLAKLCEEIENKTGFRFESEPGEDGIPIYHPRPAQWWRDRSLLGVKPEALRVPAATPKTGEELIAWRKREGVSQRDMARLLGATTPQEEERLAKAVGRVEANPLRALPAWLLEAVAALGQKGRSRGGFGTKR